MLSDTLWKCPLFYNMNKEDIEQILKVCTKRIQAVKKDEVLCHLHDIPEGIGILLQGSLQLVKYDVTGERNLLSLLHEMEVFAEMYAIPPHAALPQCIEARSDALVLWLSYEKIHTCPTSITITFMENLLTLMANKSRQLRMKNEYLSYHSIRKRLLAYFHDVSLQQQATIITIPFNRQALADYLCVDRSALCRELSKLQQEGILRYHKQEIELL